MYCNYKAQSTEQSACDKFHYQYTRNILISHSKGVLEHPNLYYQGVALARNQVECSARVS